MKEPPSALNKDPIHRDDKMDGILADVGTLAALIILLVVFVV